VQQQAGLAMDGDYGPATMEAMRWPPAAGTPETAGCVATGSQRDVGAAAPSPTLPATG
jgi:hypothetical protein